MKNLYESILSEAQLNKSILSKAQLTESIFTTNAQVAASLRDETIKQNILKFDPFFADIQFEVQGDTLKIHIKNAAFRVKDLKGLINATNDIIKVIEVYQSGPATGTDSIIRFSCKKGNYDLTIRGMDPGMMIQINPGSTLKRNAYDIVEGMTIENPEGDVSVNAILSKCNIKCKDFRRIISSSIYHLNKVCRQTIIDAQSVSLICNWNDAKEQLQPIAFLANLCDRTTPDSLYSETTGIYNCVNYTTWDKFDNIAQLLSLHLPDDILEKCGMIMPHKINKVYMVFDGHVGGPEISKKYYVTIYISNNLATDNGNKSSYTISQKYCNSKLNIAYRIMW